MMILFNMNTLREECIISCQMPIELSLSDVFIALSFTHTKKMCLIFFTLFYISLEASAVFLFNILSKRMHNFLVGCQERDIRGKTASSCASYE